MKTLIQIFPQPNDLLSLGVEDLAAVLVEVIPPLCQRAGFGFNDLLGQLFVLNGSYSPSVQDEVAFALAEALSWLETQGIIIRNPTQPATWYLLTRRGKSISNRVDVENYRKGRVLPPELLPTTLASKVHSIFLRGDYDIAIFQAFKEVEVSVRKAGRYPDGLVGRDLMQKAFNPDNGPLRDQNLIANERESEMFLFSGAIGHAKNPAGHRDIQVSREMAARLIIFAAYLLELVESRSS